MLTFSSAMNTLITLLQGIKYHYAVDIGTNLFTQTNKHHKQFPVWAHVGVLTIFYTIFAKSPYKLYFLISTYDFGMTISVRNVMTCFSIIYH